VLLEETFPHTEKEAAAQGAGYSNHPTGVKILSSCSETGSITDPLARCAIAGEKPPARHFRSKKIKILLGSLSSTTSYAKELISYVG
jgi:hypothetical protein